MKQSIILTFIFSIFAMTTFAQKPAYQLFNAEGKKVNYKKMMKQLQATNYIFIGELHNNPISHWLELEITKDLHTQLGNKLVLGAEMFEADNQLIIDEYFAEIITKKKFEAEIRKWDNYKTDYKPLVEFAKENKLKFIATNIPRRYAGVVYKQGFKGLDKLSPEAKEYICPLPPAYDANVACYAKMLEMGKQMGHTTDNFPKSQAIKDATMAHFIMRNSGAGTVFVHYNGAYHSDNHEGIVWHLKLKNKKIKVLTISTVEQDDIKKLEDDNKNKADFIIVVPSYMTKTY